MAASTVVGRSNEKSQTDLDEDNIQRIEIEELHLKYGKYCKVISNIGDFTNVVDIRIENSPLNVKFQLEESYPITAPCVVVKNACLDVADRTELMEKLNTKAQSLVGSKMMNQLVELASTWCEGREFTEVTVAKKNTSQSTGKNKKNSKTKITEREGKSERKLPPMKTSEDVISRIMWDENIPTERFCVGYEDRFVGIVERQFTEFSWEDLASVDYDTLAIPKHRIHYFKYKNLIVWDKNKRLDNVFGSTGSGITILDVIEKYECEQVTANQIKSTSNDSDSEENDEDIVITVDGEQTEDGVQYTRDKYWGPKKRPTHFLCLRITDPSIAEAMEEVHNRIIEFEPSYEESLIPTKKLHVTLACLGLDDEYEIDRASDFLRDIHSDLDSFQPKDIEIEFQGVDHFFHNVLFAKLEENEAMMNFVQHLRECVQRAGIEIRDVFDFSPHMTILKFKKHHQAMAHTRYIDSRLYDMFSNTCFGRQSFDNIYLCKMSTEEGENGGFYICPRKIKF